MPENILVVEHEPRDADLVRQALAGQPFTPLFAASGDDAFRAVQSGQPALIIMSSAVPQVGAADLIRVIRSRPELRDTPILITVAEGMSPADVAKMGATDVLARPFTASDLLGRIRRLVASRGQLTSNDIFGDITDDAKSSQPGARKSMKSDELDKLLADTLHDVMPQKGAKPKTQSGVPGLDKKLQDTLSGLEKSARAKTGPGTTPRPAVPAPPVFEEKTHIAEPIFIPPPPAAIEEEPTDGTKFGQYVLLEKIASGGMAEVWKARMRGVEGFQKIVAIKKILPHLSDNQEFVEMFIDEAKLAAQLNHNNIIHIYDLGKIQSSYYIAMEFVDGNDLKTILKRAEERDQQLSIELALFITSKIAAALDYAHRKHDYENREMGLVHRDVSPQNVLISEEGDIKLCDFGIAKAASKASHTQAGALKGKLQYMSPEQAWGKAIDRRSDIFALAAVLFEMLTRQKLFTGDNEMSILEQVREARVMPPSQINDEVSPEIDAIVLKGLAKDPANRYQTAAEMARDIDSLLYSFRPTPTNADVAIFMHRLHAAQPAFEATQIMDDLPIPPPPAPAPPPAPVVAAPPPPATVMPSWESPRTVSSPITVPPPRKSSAGMMIAIVALLAIAGGGAWFFMRGRGASGPAATVAQTQSAAPVAAAPQPVPVTDTTMTIVDATATDTASTAGLTATTATAPAIDAALVNEEVQRRLAAERSRLEQQARAASTPAPQPQPVARPVTPQPQPAAARPQPQPAVAETQTTAPQPAPQPAAEPARPAPQPAAVETARVQEGDLVTDLNGLVAARMIRRAEVPYPQMARMQRVEGRVLVSALVSETGQVLETRVLVPIKKPVGLNEAAQVIVKRSTFTPPTKDGVKVKAWTTVPIDFKL